MRLRVPFAALRMCMVWFLVSVFDLFFLDSRLRGNDGGASFYAFVATSLREMPNPSATPLP